MKNKFIRYPLILFIICGLCAAIISSTNYITSPIIAQNSKDKLDANLATLYDNLDGYELLKSEKELATPGLQSLFKLNLSDGTSRFVYQTSNIGKNGPIISLIAFNDQKIDKIVNIEHKETKGIGSKVDNAEYLETITAQDLNSLKVDTIAGATYSSTALKRSVESATKDYLKGDYK
ncbi:MAG: FMN-binding protein [Bacilli bacterium]